MPKYVKMQVAYLEFLAAGKGYSRGIKFDLGVEVMDPIVKPSYQLHFLNNLAKGYQWNRKSWRKPLMSNDEIIDHIHDPKKTNWHVEYWTRLLRMRESYKTQDGKDTQQSSF